MHRLQRDTFKVAIFDTVDAVQGLHQFGLSVVIRVHQIEVLSEGALEEAGVALEIRREHPKHAARQSHLADVLSKCVHHVDYRNAQPLLEGMAGKAREHDRINVFALH